MTVWPDWALENWLDWLDRIDGTGLQWAIVLHGEMFAIWWAAINVRELLSELPLLGIFPNSEIL